jgi:hypothetical protein
MLNPFSAVKGGIVHHKHRLRFRPFSTEWKQLLNKFLKDSAVYRALKDPCQKNTILGICRKDLVSLLTPIPGYLDGSHAKRGPTLPSKPYSLIAARFVNIYEVI